MKKKNCNPAMLLWMIQRVISFKTSFKTLESETMDSFQTKIQKHLKLDFQIAFIKANNVLRQQELMSIESKF